MAPIGHSGLKHVIVHVVWESKNEVSLKNVFFEEKSHMPTY